MLDPLSGLPRFGAQGPELPTALLSASASGQRFALLHVATDALDKTQLMQDEQACINLLAELGRRLKLLIPEGALLWRLSGDEFLVGIALKPDQADASAFAERVRDAMEAPLSMPPYSIAVHIGMAISPDQGSSAANLMASAEQDLRRTLRATMHLSNLGNDALGAPLRMNDAEFVNAFAQAIGNNEFELHYQPMVSAQDGRLTGFASFVRWRHSRRGLIRPNEFMPAVDKLGLAADLGQWVMQSAINQLQTWRLDGLGHLRLSVYLGTDLLLQPDCAPLIRYLLRQHDVPGSSLDLEISERALEIDPRAARATLAELREMDATITLHDFGAHGLRARDLRDLPVDQIKIDRSFIAESFQNPRGAAILSDMISVAHELGIAVVARGVETEFEVRFLRRSLCDYLQGYLLGQPLPAHKLGELPFQSHLLPQLFASTESGRTLLLVDDEENVLHALHRLLRRENYRVLSTTSVKEAFNLLAGNDVQVIVSDQRMDEMSGTEFLTRVRGIYPDTIRIVLSGYTDLSTITDAINHGAIYRFLTKPWNDVELRTHVRDAFNAYERRKETRDSIIESDAAYPASG
ncbi:MAG: EAL domain-containing protein [Pseudomonadota bacterium]|nr:EAL domain-containing protein [Pseudomonadota bacterium]